MRLMKMEYDTLDDIYANGVGRLSRVSSDTVRLSFYATHVDNDGNVENRPVVHIVMGNQDFSSLLVLLGATKTFGFEERPIGVEAGRELAN